MDYLIKLKHIKKIYKEGEVETIALRDISFKMKEGEFLSIMGPSGSGKSTLLHILGFLDRPTSGEYIFEGKDTKNFTEKELAKIRNQKIGFVFQMFNLLPRLTALENVMLPLIYSNIKKSKREEISKEALNSVGLYHRKDYKVVNLSGGEKQRVAIARAIVNNPKLILADEPTGNLDSKSGGIIMEILQKLNQKGHSIILITHETYTASYAQRILKIQDGKVIGEEINTNRKIIWKDGFFK